MRIVIDMQGVQNGSRHRGIGRYTREFAQALVRNRGPHDVVIVLSDLFPDSVMEVRSIFEPMLGAEGVRIWSGISPAYYLDRTNDWRRNASELIREAFLESLQPDIVIISSIFEGAGDNSITSIGEFNNNLFSVSIYYDVIPLIYENDYLADPNVKSWYFNKVAQLRNSDLLLAISQSACDEAEKYLGFERDRLLNISAAVSPQFNTLVSLDNEDLSGFKKRFGVMRPFVMYSGATDPRKNVRGLIDAWAMLPKSVRTAHQLALVGGMPNDHQESLQQYAKSKGVSQSELIFSGQVTDEEMILFYRQCQAFIMPSLHEGFGLPVLEAMVCGAPTIGSNCSSIPEVIGMDEALFDPRSPSDIASHIVRVLTDEDFRRRLIQNGYSRSRMFSWDKSACVALAKFEQLEADGLLRAKSLVRCGEAVSHELIKAISVIPAIDVDDSDLLACGELIAQLFPREDSRPRLYVDISELHRRDSRTGIQRVVRSVVKCLLELSVDTHIISLVYATENEPYRHAWRFSQMLTEDAEVSGINIEDDVIDPRSGDIFLGLDFQDQIVVAHEPYFERLRRHGIRVCFVVYDLLPIALTGIFSRDVRANYEKWLNVVAKQDAAICISQATANELRDWYKCRAGVDGKTLQINWFHLGGDVENSNPTRGLPNDFKDQLRRMTENPCFLMVGTIEPRKSHSQVLDAFEILWAQGNNFHLLLVGREGWMVDELVSRLRNHPLLEKQLFWIENASDECLDQIYTVSSCLIAASIGEGFGLPLIEAAKYKLPLLIRNLPVFREVAGNNAYYFSGESGVHLATAIQAWFSLFEKGQHPRSDNMHWLTWRQSTAQLLKSVIR